MGPALAAKDVDMNIKNLPAAKNRACELERQAHRLQAKIYDFQDELEMAGLFLQAKHAGEAAFEIDETQIKLQAIFK